VFRTTRLLSVRFVLPGSRSLHPAVPDNTHGHPDELGHVDHGCLYKTKCVIRLQKNLIALLH
jgi:hypothetical protein